MSAMEDEDEMIESSFREFDKNEDGFIELKELRYLLLHSCQFWHLLFFFIYICSPVIRVFITLSSIGTSDKLVAEAQLL